MQTTTTQRHDRERALDDVIWSALTSEQSGLARRAGDAACFDPAFTSLAGVRAPTPEAFAALGSLLADGERTGLFVDEGVEVSGALEVVDGAPLVQMIQRAPGPAVDAPAFVALSAADVPAMLELTALTRPGPFGPRTHELGLFLGVREGERLVAMAGRRLRLAGLTEISAVCTHPDHLGRGHAARLLAAQASRIHAEGATPFLHVRADNARAIALYERLGFVVRRRARYAVVQRRVA